MRVFSQVVSWVLMPILMPMLGLILVMYTISIPMSIADGNSMYQYNDAFKTTILSFFLFFTVIAPVVLYLILMSFGVIKTPQLDDKSERKYPMMIMSSLCFMLYFVFSRASDELPKYIYALCLSGGAIIGIFTYVNNYIKVSLHATGVGILTGFVFAYVLEQLYFEIWILAVVILISGIVLSSRLYLEKHTPKELMIGYFFSLITTFVFNFYYPEGLHII